MTPPLDPLTFLHGPAMPNRFMLAPLTNRQSHADGVLSDDECRWLAMRAQGGFGLTMTCAAHVQAVGQGFGGQLGIFGDEHVDGLARLADVLNDTGTVSYVQLHHAGMRSPADLIGAQPVCPSDDVQTGARALTTAEVEQVGADFVAAARRAHRAGFHGVELHGAHGYLLCQFLSPEINRRTDRYGGSLDNRSRLLLDIVDGIRAECGDGFAIAVRLSSDRFGIVTDEMVTVYERLIAGGAVDMVDLSLWDVRRQAKGGTFAGMPLLDVFAGVERGGVRLAVAGKVHEPADVREVLDRGADIAALGRVSILHHDYPQRYAADAAFTPRHAPVPAAVLESEGVSPTFVEYLRSSFQGFVAD